MYKEKTNVLSYYIIKTILLYHYPLFLQWCDTNNFSLLQFKKTETNLVKFCDFIIKYHKSKNMIEMLKEMEFYLEQLKISTLVDKKTLNIKTKNVLENMRMSICELG